MRLTLRSFLGLSTLFLAFVFAPGGAAAPLGASAQSRVVVRGFSGPNSGRLRASLVSSLESGGVVVVPEFEVTQAQQQLGMSRLSRRNYPAVAAHLGVSAFIEGRVTRRRRRWSLGVRVMSASGQPLGSAQWAGRTAGALGAVGRNGYARLSRYLGEAPPIAQPLTPTQPVPGQPWYQGSQPSQPQQGVPITEPSPATGTEEEPTPSAPASNRLDWLTISGSAGFLHRSMEADAIVMNNMRDPTGPDQLTETRSYTSPGIGAGELGLAAEVYPGAISDDQPFPWIGLRIAYSHSVFLSAKGCRVRGTSCPANEVIDVPTDQQELYLGARARYRFGEERSDPELYLDAGYNLFEFSFGYEELQMLERTSVIPPISLSTIHLGAGISYFIDSIDLTLDAHIGYRIGLFIGVETKEVWGANTNQMSALAFGLDLNLGLPSVADGLFLGLGFELLRYSTKYEGQTVCVVPRADCTPSAPWEQWPHVAGVMDQVTGGILEPVTDLYLRSQLRIGYEFR